MNNDTINISFPKEKLKYYDSGSYTFIITLTENDTYSIDVAELGSKVGHLQLSGVYADIEDCYKAISEFLAQPVTFLRSKLYV